MTATIPYIIANIMLRLYQLLIFIIPLFVSQYAVGTGDHVFAFPKNKVKISLDQFIDHDGAYQYEIVDEIDIRAKAIPPCSKIVFPIIQCRPSICYINTKLGRSYRKIVGKTSDNKCLYQEYNFGYGELECHLPMSYLSEISRFLSPYNSFSAANHILSMKQSNAIYSILQEYCHIMKGDRTQLITLDQKFTKESCYAHFIQEQINKRSEHKAGNLSEPMAYLSFEHEAGFLESKEIQSLFNNH